MRKYLGQHRQRGQTLAEVLAIAAVVLVVLLIIIWLVDKYRDKGTKVDVPSSLTWAQGQGGSSKPSATALPGSSDTLFDAVPPSVKLKQEGDEEGDEGFVTVPGDRTTGARSKNSTNSKNVNSSLQSGVNTQPEKEGQSAAVVNQIKLKTNPVMDLNAANAEMEAALMNKMMRRSNDAYELGLDGEDASIPLADKEKKDDDKILIPGAVPRQGS